MKNAIRLVLTLLIIALAATLLSCTNEVGSKQTVNEGFSTELYNVKGGWQFNVIEFEGHRYLAPSKGGVIHVESCDCNQFNR